MVYFHGRGFHFGKAPKPPKPPKRENEPKPPKQPKMKNLWKVTLKFGFKRTNRSYDHKPWPTVEEINKYMLKDKKYKMYIESLFLYDGYNQKPKNITFKDGIATFYIDPTVLEVWDKVPMFPTVDKLSYYLEHINLADGLWEGMPGSPGVYPVDSTNKEEFGVINFGDIVIQPV